MQVENAHHVPGAVEQGLVAGSISWWTAMKVAIFIAVLVAIFRGGRAGAKARRRGYERR